MAQEGLFRPVCPRAVVAVGSPIGGRKKGGGGLGGGVLALSGTQCNRDKVSFTERINATLMPCMIHNKTDFKGISGCSY